MSFNGSGEQQSVGSELPDNISYDNSDLKRSLVKKMLRANTWYKGKCVGASYGTWPKSGKVYLETVWNPLNAEGQVKSPSARFRLTVPFLPDAAKANDPKAVVPNTFGMCHEFMEALYPEEYSLPTFDREVGTWVTAKGEAITNAAAASLKESIIDTATKQITTHYYGVKGSNAKELIGEFAYFLTEDNDYRGVKRIAGEPPDGVQVQLTDLTDPNFVES